MTPDRTRLASERGYAVVTAVLVSLVVLTLSLTAFSLSAHNQDASALDRERVRAIHAAEAGINQALADIAHVGATTPPPCAIQASLTDSLHAAYDVTITYYAAWPFDNTTTPLACTSGVLSDPAAPGAARVDAVGTAGNARRRMETAVRLSPAFHGIFDKAIFSDTTPSVGNDLHIDGDVYTNGAWLCPNKTVVDGNLYVQGRVEMGNTCEVTKTMWSGGPAYLKNQAKVGHDAIVAGEDDTSITWENPQPKTRGWSLLLANETRVVNRVQTYGTCEGCESPRVNPDLVATNLTSLSGPPPEPLPPLPWNESDWTDSDPPFTVEERATCEGAHTLINEIAGPSPNRTGKHVVRITDKCTLTFANNANYTLNDDLAIITDGAIEFVNDGVWKGVGDPTLYLIVPSPADCTIEPYGTITKQNSTQFIGLYFFVYSPCTINFANLNDSDTEGQIYGGEVHLANFFRLTGHAAFVPGTGNGALAGYRSEVAFIREINL